MTISLRDYSLSVPRTDNIARDIHMTRIASEVHGIAVAFGKMLPQKMHFTVLLVLYSCWSIAVSSAAEKPPNIVFILTDDQDVVLGGLVSDV